MGMVNNNSGFEFRSNATHFCTTQSLGQSESVWFVELLGGTVW